MKVWDFHLDSKISIKFYQDLDFSWFTGVKSLKIFWKANRSLMYSDNNLQNLKNFLHAE